MKKKLFLMSCFLGLSLLAIAKPSNETTKSMTPPPLLPYHTIDSITKVSISDCQTLIYIWLTATAPVNLQVDVTVSVWPNLSSSTPVSIGSPNLSLATGSYYYAFPVSPSNPAVYHITVTDVDNFISFTRSITANSKRCYFDKGHFLAGYDDIDVNLPRFTPEDSGEDMNLAVNWKFEEIDQNFQSAYSVSGENTICWNDVNLPRKVCTFKGFDGFNSAESIAELEAGECSDGDGIFDPDKVYLITRSFRLPGDPWESYALFIGPGTEEPEDINRSIESSMESANLFRLAQDRTARTVTFQTELHTGRFEIVDAAGRHLKSIDLSEEAAAYTVDVAAFAKGLYVVRLVSGSQTSTEKFVVE